MTATAACVRGCKLYRRHLTDCPLPDMCRGCLPRRADHGTLCWPCHRRLERMIVDTPIVVDWLTANLSTSGSQRPTDDVQIRHTKPSETPLPIRTSVYDTRDQLCRTLTKHTHDLALLLNVTAPQDYPQDQARFLRRWLPHIETMTHATVLYTDLAEAHTEAHKLAPWRPVNKRVGRVPCPECGETNLVIFGGESDVTCQSCWTVIPERTFGLWEQIVKEQDLA